MTPTDIDPYPVAQLVDRYQKSRDIIYKRFDFLGIKPHKAGRGNLKYITLDELHRMDALHQHVQAGGNSANFQDAMLETVSPDTTDTSFVSLQSDNVSRQLSGLSIDQFLELAAAVSKMLRPQDPFYHYEQLERFSRFGWQIHSTDLRSLLGRQQLKSSPIRYGSFLISRVGFRWWKVEKKD